MTDPLIAQSNTLMSLTDAEYSRATLLASDFGQSGMFPSVKNKAQAMVLILVGNEIGVSALAALTGIHMIAGKPVVGANLMAERIKSSGKYNYSILEHTSEICKIEFIETATKTSLGVSEFNMKDYLAAGLMGNPNWKKYPKNMLFARALSNGQRWFCPDVFNGKTIYTPDEMGAVVDESGDLDPVASRKVIDSTANTVTPSSYPLLSEEFINKIKKILEKTHKVEECEGSIVENINIQAKTEYENIYAIPAKYAEFVEKFAKKMIATFEERQKRIAEIHVHLENYSKVHDLEHDEKIVRNYLKYRIGVESMTEMDSEQITTTLNYIKKTINLEDADEDFYIFYKEQRKNETVEAEVEVVEEEKCEGDPSESNIS